MNLLKKILSLLLLGIVVNHMFIDNVSAEEVCENYTNYYFFNFFPAYNRDGIEGATEQIDFDTYVDKTKDRSWIVEHSTYFPSLEESFRVEEQIGLASNQYIKLSDGGARRVCLYHNNETKNAECALYGEGYDFWTLTEFYTRYLEARNAAESNSNAVDVVPFTLNQSALVNKEFEANVYRKETENQNYIIHGRWFNIIGEDEEEVDSSVVINEFNDISKIPALVDASILPVSLEFNTSDSKVKEPFSVKITRTISSDFNNNIKPLVAKWTIKDLIGFNNADVNTLISPALYKIDYEVCENKYKATIKYIDGDSGEELVDDWVKTDLEDGYNEEVSSPDITHCTTDEKIVNVSIAGKDFEKVVKYICKNPQGGTAFIYIIFAIAVVAIAGIVYYVKLKKQEQV